MSPRRSGRSRWTRLPPRRAKHPQLPPTGTRTCATKRRHRRARCVSGASRALQSAHATTPELSRRVSATLRRCPTVRMHMTRHSRVPMPAMSRRCQHQVQRVSWKLLFRSGFAVAAIAPMWLRTSRRVGLDADEAFEPKSFAPALRWHDLCSSATSAHPMAMPTNADVYTFLSMMWCCATSGDAQTSHFELSWSRTNGSHPQGEVLRPADLPLSSPLTANGGFHIHETHDTLSQHARACT